MPINDDTRISTGAKGAMPSVAPQRVCDGVIFSPPAARLVTCDLTYTNHTRVIHPSCGSTCDLTHTNRTRVIRHPISRLLKCLEIESPLASAWRCLARRISASFRVNVTSGGT